MNVADAVLRPAQGADLPGIVTLLTACGLPASDLNEASLAYFQVVESAGQLVGVAGLDVVPGHGLLRSVAVAPDFRGTGVASRLVKNVEDAACNSALTALYLLAKNAKAASYLAHRLCTGGSRPRSAPAAGASGIQPAVSAILPLSAQGAFCSVPPGIGSASSTVNARSRACTRSRRQELTP